MSMSKAAKEGVGAELAASRHHVRKDAVSQRQWQPRFPTTSTLEIKPRGFVATGEPPPAQAVTGRQPDCAIFVARGFCMRTANRTNA